MEKENIFLERLTPLTKKERLVAFYKSQKFADCTFRMNGTEVKAHKLILACSSPVFEKMFYGEMASNEVIISDIDVTEFRQVLEFIYTEHINISTMMNAWLLLYIANKYLLDDLTQVCLNYIQKNITMSTLILSYEYAEMYNLLSIKRKCFSDIINYITGAFCSDYHMKSSTLRAILEEDIDLEESELVVQILNWAAIECEFRKVEVTPENIIEIVKEEGILKHIRMMWMLNLKCNRCSDLLVVCQCLDELIHQSLVLIDEILGKGDPCNRTKALQFIPKICRVRKEFKIAHRVDLHRDEEYVSSISANRKMILFGMLIKTEMNSCCPLDINDDSKYEGSITVSVCELNSTVAVAKPAIFQGVICYDSDLYVCFKDLVVLESNLLYDIRISYRNHTRNRTNTWGDSPVHFYYMSNKLVNDRLVESVISFYEMSGSVIKGIAFYPA